MDASRLLPSWMRLVHRWYAEMSGDFWRRCILCLREYGGHEWRAHPGAIPDPQPSYIGADTESWWIDQAKEKALAAKYKGLN